MEELTALELRQSVLQALKELLASQSDEPGEGTGNFWLAAAIDLIQQEINLFYDEDTGELDLTPKPLPAYDPVSPPEAQVLEGYTNVQGLNVSRARGPMGGFKIKSRIIMADRCINDPARMVSEFGGSERIYPMIGHTLNLQPWHYLPTHQVAGESYEPVIPEIPFSEEEKRLWVENFERFHFGGGALVGAKLQSDRMLMNPLLRNRGLNEEPIPLVGYRIWTVPNSPELVIPRLVDLFETTKFMRRAYASAINLAHTIDRTRAGMVPGYTPPELVGGEHSFAWYKASGESKQSDKWPIF